MEPIKFPEHNTVYAENQPEYLPLPVFKQEDGMLISCWKLSLWERIKLLWTGKLWLFVLTFNQPLQPLKPTVERPFQKPKGDTDEV